MIGGRGVNCWVEFRKYVDSLAAVRVKGGEIDRCWGKIGLHYVPLAFQYINGCSDER